MDPFLDYQKPHSWTALLQLVRQQHTFLDACCREWLAGHQGSGVQIFCHRGCHNCCSLAVNCTFAEALLIAQNLTEAQQGAVRTHAGRLRAALGDVTSLKDYLKMHRRQMGFCPFLDVQGACSIYHCRPLSCRSLLSTREEQYCAADFGELPKEKVWAFLGSLDRQIVAFPSHYVAYSQQLGQQLEAQAQQKMVQQFGFALSGNLPFLIDLELQLDLSSVIAQGRAATKALLEGQGAILPYLLEMPSLYE
jgi:Fe-S-cluster containining protein